MSRSQRQIPNLSALAGPKPSDGEAWRRLLRQLQQEYERKQRECAEFDVQRQDMKDPQGYKQNGNRVAVLKDELQKCRFIWSTNDIQISKQRVQTAIQRTLESMDAESTGLAQTAAPFPQAPQEPAFNYPQHASDLAAQSHLTAPENQLQVYNMPAHYGQNAPTATESFAPEVEMSSAAQGGLIRASSAIRLDAVRSAHTQCIEACGRVTRDWITELCKLIAEINDSHARPVLQASQNPLDVVRQLQRDLAGAQDDGRLKVVEDSIRCAQATHERFSSLANNMGSAAAAGDDTADVASFQHLASAYSTEAMTLYQAQQAAYMAQQGQWEVRQRQGQAMVTAGMLAGQVLPSGTMQHQRRQLTAPAERLSIMPPSDGNGNGEGPRVHEYLAGVAPSSSVSRTRAEIKTGPAAMTSFEPNDEQVQDLVKNNLRVRTILQNNIRKGVTAESEKLNKVIAEKDEEITRLNAAQATTSDGSDREELTKQLKAALEDKEDAVWQCQH